MTNVTPTRNEQIETYLAGLDEALKGMRREERDEILKEIRTHILDSLPEDPQVAIEPVLHGVFEEFAGGAAVTPAPFPRIPFDEAMAKYGTDKPDLRNPIRIADVTDVFQDSGFSAFARAIAAGRAARAPAASPPRRAAPAARSATWCGTGCALPGPRTASAQPPTRRSR